MRKMNINYVWISDKVGKLIESTTASKWTIFYRIETF